MHRTPLFLAAAVFAAALAGCGGSSEPAAAPPGSSAAAGPNTVTTKLLSFVPATLTVKVGGAVTWHDGDSIQHTVTTGTYQVGADGLRTTEHADGLLDKQLGRGADVSFTFTRPGTYSYFCSIHKGMNGTVVVTP